MEKPHAHAAAIDRIGVSAIIAHFGLSRRAVNYWRLRGIPKHHRRTVKMLGAVAGRSAPEIELDD